MLTPEQLFELFHNGEQIELQSDQDFCRELCRTHFPVQFPEINQEVPGFDWYRTFKDLYDTHLGHIPQTNTKQLISLIRMKDSQRIRALLKTVGKPTDPDIKEKLLAQGFSLDALVRPSPPYSILQLAIQYGLADSVELFLSYGANVANIYNSWQNFNNFGLFHTLYQPNEAIFRILLAHGASMSVRNSLQQDITPLHHAAGMENPVFFDLLLEHGADPNVADQRTVTPLHIAAQRGDIYKVRALLDHGALVNGCSEVLVFTPLMSAAMRGNNGNNIEVEAELLQRGGFVTLIRGRTFEEYQRLLSVLMRHPTIDCTKQQGFALRQLLNYLMYSVDGVGLMFGDLTDLSPQEEIYFRMIAYLIEHGPRVVIPEERVNHKFDQLPTPLEFEEDDDPFYLESFALQTILFQSPILELFLKRDDFDVNASIDNTVHNPVLHMAVVANSDRQLELVLERPDLYINQLDHNQNTALICAIGRRSDNRVEKLLEIKGIDVNTWHTLSKNLTTEWGVDACEALITVNDKEIIGTRGTPLHLAALVHPSSITSLLKLGAHVDAKMSCGLTTLQIVENKMGQPSNGNYFTYCDAYRRLLQAGAAIHAEGSTIPKMCDTTNMVLIGFKYGDAVVSRTTTGFEKAITSTPELVTALRSGAAINRKGIIAVCDRRLECEQDPAIAKSLLEIKTILQRCPPETTLKAICLNKINFYSYEKFFALRATAANFQLYLMAKLPATEKEPRYHNVLTVDGLFQYNDFLNRYDRRLSPKELTNIGLKSLIDKAGQLHRPKRVTYDLKPKKLIKLNEMIVKNGGVFFSIGDHLPQELSSNFLAYPLDNDGCHPGI